MKVKHYMPAEFSRKFDQVVYDSGLTCKQIAELTGVERKAISNYRLGHNIPNVCFLMKFCATFHVSADWLLGIKEEK